MKILTIGGAVQDTTINTKEGQLIKNSKDLTRQKLLAFEFGAKVNIPDVEFFFGGGASNTAINFANLGENVHTLICVGEDGVGQAIVKNLKEKSIKTNLIQTSEKVSGFSFVINAKNLGEEHTLFTHRGANEDLKIELDELTKNKFDLIYLSSLSGKGHKNNLPKVFNYKKRYKDTQIAWNPGNLQIKLGLNNLKQFLETTDFVIVNKDEAIELCMSVEKETTNPRDLLKKIREYCPNTIVITDGSNGAYCYHEKEIHYTSSCSVNVKDTTGVGDAFGSTFVWAMLNHYIPEKSLEIAIKNACSVLQHTGAQLGFLKASSLKIR